MIHVHLTERTITIKGHAYYDAPGKDIICAGISALADTLAISITELCTDMVSCIQENGNIRIKFEDKSLSEHAQLLISSFSLGVQGIAEVYPDYVHYVDIRPGLRVDKP